MAKVVGPLMSIDARGKIADALVFIGWKGIKDVRMWLKPAQPKTTLQGVVRTILGGLGRSAKPVEKGSNFHKDAVALAPAQQSWISRYVQYIRKTYMADAGAYEDLVTEYSGHSAKSSFDSAAASLGLSDFGVPYKGELSTFTAGLMLYCLAKYGCDNVDAATGIFNRSPYTKALAQWTASDVSALVADIKVS